MSQQDGFALVQIKIRVGSHRGHNRLHSLVIHMQNHSAVAAMQMQMPGAIAAPDILIIKLSPALFLNAANKPLFRHRGDISVQCTSTDASDRLLQLINSKQIVGIFRKKSQEAISLFCVVFFQEKLLLQYLRLIRKSYCSTGASFRQAFYFSPQNPTTPKNPHINVIPPDAALFSASGGIILSVLYFQPVLRTAHVILIILEA
jgi:hypothetical protein